MIFIGTSGFSYDDWKGAFYPEKIRKGDMFSFYVDRFSAVEINSTYYAIPSPSMFVKLDEKSPPNFRFVVKAPRKISHEGTTPPDVYDRFLDAVRPIVASGKLGCILVHVGYTQVPCSLFLWTWTYCRPC